MQIIVLFLLASSGIWFVHPDRVFHTPHTFLISCHLRQHEPCTIIYNYRRILIWFYRDSHCACQWLYRAPIHVYKISIYEAGGVGYSLCYSRWHMVLGWLLYQKRLRCLIIRIGFIIPRSCMMLCEMSSGVVSAAKAFVRWNIVFRHLIFVTQECTKHCATSICLIRIDNDVYSFRAYTFLCWVGLPYKLSPLTHDH